MPIISLPKMPLHNNGSKYHCTQTNGFQALSHGDKSVIVACIRRPLAAVISHKFTAVVLSKMTVEGTNS